MKPGQNAGKQRSRGRSNNGGGGKGRMPSRNQTYDSNGPDIRIRGNAHQVLEKYLTLARDASSQGDRIAAENYYQHAEHYFRVINNQAQNNGNRPVMRPLVTPADDHVLLSGDLESYENDSPITDDDGDGEIEADAEGEGDIREDGGEDARQDMRREGRQDGRQEGRQDGRRDGRHEGRYEGRQNRRYEGRHEGRNEGQNEGRQGEGRQGGRPPRAERYVAEQDQPEALNQPAAYSQGEAEVIVRQVEIVAPEAEPAVSVAPAAAPAAEEEPVVVKRRRGPRRTSTEPTGTVNA